MAHSDQRFASIARGCAEVLRSRLADGLTRAELQQHWPAEADSYNFLVDLWNDLVESQGPGGDDMFRPLFERLLHILENVNDADRARLEFREAIAEWDEESA